MFDAAIVSEPRNCPVTIGSFGPRAGTGDGAVSAIFSDWPAEGAVLDLSIPGTSDLVVVSADAGATSYCSNVGVASGFVSVRVFERYYERWILDIKVDGVVLEGKMLDGTTAVVDAHLYH
jgi:hypothetical protein